MNQYMTIHLIFKEQSVAEVIQNADGSLLNKAAVKSQKRETIPASAFAATE
jgi:hypothetical protein